MDSTLSGPYQVDPIKHQDLSNSSAESLSEMGVNSCLVIFACFGVDYFH